MQIATIQRAPYKTKRKRIIEIDFLRGVCVILMIVDHFFYDYGFLMPSIFGEITGPAPLLALHNSATWYWVWSVRVITRYVVIALFFFLSGLSTQFSRSNVKRGTIYFFVGLIISFTSYQIDVCYNIEGLAMIINTILTFGLAILIYGLYQMFMNFIFKKNKYPTIIISTLVGIAIIIAGYCSPYFFSNESTFYYQDITFNNLMRSLFGYGKFGPNGDYMPLFPYLGYIFLGSAISALIYKDRKSLLTPLVLKYENMNESILKKTLNGPIYFAKGVGFMGHHAFIIYFAHQVILIIIACIVMLSLGYTLNL